MRYLTRLNCKNTRPIKQRFLGSCVERENLSGDIAVPEDEVEDVNKVDDGSNTENGVSESTTGTSDSDEESNKMLDA